MQIRKNKSPFFGLALLLSSIFLTEGKAQITKDAGLWTSITADYNFSMELSAQLNQEFRFNENISELGSYFTEVGVMYKFLDRKLRTSFNYRFANKRRLDDSYSKRHRYNIDIAYREKAGPLALTFRTRFQSQYRNVLSSDDGRIPTNYWRNRIGLKMDLDKKYRPYFGAELFTDIAERVNDNIRFTFGVDYELNKIHNLSFFWMHQREFNVRRPVYDYVFGIGYSINVDYLIGSEN
jgi:hypothetical protein